MPSVYKSQSKNIAVEDLDDLDDLDDLHDLHDRDRGLSDAGILYFWTSSSRHATCKMFFFFFFVTPRWSRS